MKRCCSLLTTKNLQKMQEPSDSVSLQDPLQKRLDLMEGLIDQLSLSSDQTLALRQDLTILNSFALAKDWEKVELLIKTWSNKVRGDPSASILAEKKWSLSVEVAIDAEDLDLLKKLLEVCGKNKRLRVRLPMMAIALEKQEDALTNLLLWGCSQLKDLEADSILAGLPEQQSRARQMLFNRYCVVRNDEILKELFQDIELPDDLDQSQLDDLANEHRVAMISYLSRGKDAIVVTQDTMWNTVKSGHAELAQLLETLKVESNFKWMESAEAPTPESSLTRTGSFSSLSSELANLKGEKLESFMAMYAAYGGKVSEGMDSRLRKQMITRTNSFSSCRSRSNSALCPTGTGTGTPALLKVSYIAKAIIESRDDKDWLSYLRGETEELPGLSWMEPKSFSTPDIQQDSDPAFDKAYETLAILQGLSGRC